MMNFGMIKEERYENNQNLFDQEKCENQPQYKFKTHV